MSGTPRPARREQLERVTEHYRLQARQYADRVLSLVLLTDAYGTDARSLLLDLAGSARMGQIRATGELERAQRLHDFYPRVLDLLRTGDLLVPVVELLLHKTKHCSEKVHNRLGQVLPLRLAGLDAADAYEVIARTVLEVESELELQEQQERHAKANANRGVWVLDVQDGMARVGAEVDALTARTFALDLDVLVRAEAVRDRRDGIVRTASQRRADVLMELPARYHALLEALASGKADGLRRQAARRQQHSPATRVQVQDELPLGVPPQGRASCWSLDVQELTIELLRQPLGPRAVLNVHQPMSSALGLDESPARIQGGEYVPAWLARLMLPDAALRRVAVDAETGIPIYLDRDLLTSHRRPPDSPPGPGRQRPPDPPEPAPAGAEPANDDEQIQLELRQNEERLASARACQQALLSMIGPLLRPDTTEPQYTPSTGLRALVRARDQRCRGVGCRRPAHLCDLDHERKHAEGGPTSEPNVDAKSRRCHLARHNGWEVVRDPRTSISTWTSPDGSTYTRLPAWVRHHSHEPVVRLGLHVTELPTAQPDRPGDRPLWRPPATTAPRPTATPMPAPRPHARPQDWNDGPPPF